MTWILPAQLVSCVGQGEGAQGGGHVCGAQHTCGGARGPGGRGGRRTCKFTWARPPGVLKVLGHRLAFNILQERSVGPVGVSRGGGSNWERACARLAVGDSGTGRGRRGGVPDLLFCCRGEPRSSPVLQPSCRRKAGGGRVAHWQGLLRAGGGGLCGGVCARREVRGYSFDINLATGCVRALLLLLPSCWRRG
jgi:hypothetical protein